MSSRPLGIEPGIVVGVHSVPRQIVDVRRHQRSNGQPPGGSTYALPKLHGRKRGDQKALLRAVRSSIGGGLCELRLRKRARGKILWRLRHTAIGGRYSKTSIRVGPTSHRRGGASAAHRDVL